MMGLNHGIANVEPPERILPNATVLAAIGERMRIGKTLLSFLLMFSPEELVTYLDSRFRPKAVILYGSAASGELTPTSDIDVVCFVEGDEAYPELGAWGEWLLDVWIHPVGDAERADEFLKLHDGRVLRDDQDGTARTLLDRVTALLSQPPPPLDPRHERHRRAWGWKMFDRVHRGDIEGDHRRHWLLYDLPQIWCELHRAHYLGPANAFKAMRIRDEAGYLALQEALVPEASLSDIERGVIAIVGERG